MKRCAEEDATKDPEVERTEKILRKLERLDRKRDRDREEMEGDQDEQRADMVDMWEFGEVNEEKGPVEVLKVDGIDERFDRNGVALNEIKFEEMVMECGEVDGTEGDVWEKWEKDCEMGEEDGEEEGMPKEMDEESNMVS